MATVHPSHSRSASDPFTDPALPLRRAPPLPPNNKSNQLRMPAPVPKSARDHTDITEAVRDTVTVRGNTDYSSRNHMARSQTSNIPSHSSRPAQPRSQSQDSANRPDKSKASVKSRPKKGSQHADVIDRLDFTGVGPMFHHDGPFDACAPSRNRQRNKAPMFAWTPRPDDIPASSDSAYPSAHAHKAFSNTNYVDPPKKKVDAIAEAWGIHEPEPYEEFFAGGGTGRTDGDTPASSIYNGKDSHSQSSRTANGQKRGKEARDIYREYLEGGQPANGDAARPRVATRRTLVPPPQPIFVPDPAEIPDAPGLSPPLSAPGFPKRSKSLMHRIRKMRDAPNVPVGSDYDQTPPSPTSLTDATSNTPRPTHRPQNSFLGRFGGGGARNASATSDKSEPFVYIEANNKELPAPPPGVVESPPDVPVMGYFDNSANSGSPGLGRKTSLLKKVGRVVGRGRQ